MSVKKINSKTIRETYQQGKEAIGKAYKTVKQSTEPKIRATIEYAQAAFNPPKAEVLSRRAADAQEKYLKQTLYLKSLERNFSNMPNLILENRKVLGNLEQEAFSAVQKYNNFLAKQNAAQKAFEALNK